MAEPVVELIAVDIAAKIALVTTANGFHQDLVAVRDKRVAYRDQAPVENTVLLVQEDEDDWGEQPNTTRAWEQPFALQAIVLDSDSDSTAIDIKRNRVRADLQKKLMEDPTRDGNANDTIMMPSTLFNDGEGFSGIQVNILVRYRTKITDPYTRA